VRRGVAAAFPRQLQAIITTREVWASHRYPGRPRGRRGGGDRDLTRTDREARKRSQVRGLGEPFVDLFTSA